MLSGKRGFSLIEILVAICIVVIVATIAVPVYSSLQTDVQQAAAIQIQSELNGAYAKWKDSGGMITANATTSDILWVLSAPTPADGSARKSPNGAVVDGGVSNLVSVTLPQGTDLSPYLTSSSVTVMTGGPTPFLIESQRDIFPAACCA